MKGFWGRCLEIILADRPGRDVKWLLLMASMKVDLAGLKSVVLNYWASLRLVMACRRMPFAWFGWECFDGCWAWGMGSPLVWSRKTVIITWLCFNIFTSNLVKMETQSSSQSCPMEMREPVVMSLKTWADCALE